MPDSVRASRRWPWIVGVAVSFFGGCGLGLLLFAAGMAHMFDVPCPAVYRPRAGDDIAPLQAGPGIFQPRLLSHPMGSPRAGRVAHVQGTVMLLVHVGTDGSVTETRLLRSSGFCPFDIEALSGVKSWRFSPGMRLGEPVAAWRLLNIRFDRGASAPTAARYANVTISASNPAAAQTERPWPPAPG